MSERQYGLDETLTKLARENNDMLFPLPDGRILRLSAYITDPEGVEVSDAQR